MVFAVQCSASICSGWKRWCLLYAGFFLICLITKANLALWRSITVYLLVISLILVKTLTSETPPTLFRQCPKLQKQIFISHSQYLVTNPVQSALPSNKGQKGKHFFKIFGSARPWDQRGQGTYSKFLQSPLIIHLWMEECQILMIFPYFSEKCRRSSAQDYAINANTSCFVGCFSHVCLKKYKDSCDIIFYDWIFCCLGNYGHGVSKVWCKWCKERSMFLATLNLKVTNN